MLEVIQRGWVAITWLHYYCQRYIWFVTTLGIVMDLQNSTVLVTGATGHSGPHDGFVDSGAGVSDTLS